MFEKEKAIEQCKLLLRMENDEKDALLAFLTDGCVARILGYCRRKELPDGLVPLVPVMTARMYEVNDYGGEGKEVVGWKQGERSETYEDGSVRRDDWMNDFVSQLEPFRVRKGYVPSEIQSI